MPISTIEAEELALFPSAAQASFELKVHDSSMPYSFGGGAAEALCGGGPGPLPRCWWSGMAQGMKELHETWLSVPVKQKEREIA